MIFNKILIANRGEIASRIIFACKSLNIKTVAIYYEQDKSLPYVFQADENHKLSGSGASAYLNQEEIINIAKKFNVEAIHPGYGFLSENSDFAQKVIAAGINWIGPSPEIIKLMGDKINAKNIMLKAGVPTIPAVFVSHDIEINKLLNLININIGYPVILKDPLGGGGKGIKKVFNPEELESAFNTIKSESSRLTSSNNILIEKYIQKGRHIEVQVAGDGKNFVHLYERECSIQRRHQKIIEEAPCNFLDKNILNNIYNAAIKAISIINYDNIGTVEFIVTPDNNFYFLEINTRLQVEHSVTESITGIDLVLLQISLAQEKNLNLKQENINIKNHAIECRIYAEDPNNSFMPSTGKIINLILPNTPNTRIDSNLEQDQEITAFFDPMLAKITCSGTTRNIAIKNMLTILNQTEISGIKNNINFLINILNSPEFNSGDIHTQLIESNILNFLNNNNFINTHELEIANIFLKFIQDKNINSNKFNINNYKNIKNWGRKSWL
ncbi:MAG: Propionyl-CoA carboxylase subunit alpha [candidate division TM6 bacterium GW2011_GWF2_28_16]|nr:MAG: Propionyl-CoA carboxylase subunit alpha [candidate division TM6 bacterium GW2011_GWF2_28_16]